MGSVVEKINDEIGQVVEDVVGAVGNVFSAVGLESLGDEITRWGEDIHQLENVMSGKYASDQKRAKEYQNKVENYAQTMDARTAVYNNDVDKLVDKMESLIAFHEIFQFAMGNKLDAASVQYSAEMAQMNSEYGAMVGELKRMVAKIESEYDFIIGLTEGAFIQKIVGSVIIIIGGIMSDLGEVLSGKANSDTWKRVGMVIVLVILIIIAIFFPPAWGLVSATSAAWTVTYTVIVGLTILNAFMTLDGMYANGVATGAMMGVLDTIFNDLLNFDDLIGSDFDKFDKNNEDYAQMVGYVQLAIGLTQMYLAWTSSAAYYAAQETAAREAAFAAGGSVKPEASMLGISGGESFTDTAVIGQSKTASDSAAKSMFGGAVEINSKNISNSALFGVKFATFSDIYDAFTSSLKIKDYISANKQYEDMNKKFQEEMDKVNAAITSKANKNMMKHYKDSAYFLQDQQEYIDRYVYGMTANSMYVDPYGTTPVANIRFTPDKDTRMMSFGFEDVFNESKMAGSKNYFNSIIYE